MGEWVQSGWKKLQITSQSGRQTLPGQLPQCFFCKHDSLCYLSLGFYLCVIMRQETCGNNTLISIMTVSFQLETLCVAGIPISPPFLHLFNHASLATIFYPLFSPSLSSSISLFSTLLHWSPTLNWFWSYCHSLPPIPSLLLFRASWPTGG